GGLLLDPLSHLLEEGPLLGGEARPLAGVELDAELERIEARIDPILGPLLPPEIEDADSGPTVAVDHAALERGVDLAAGGLHDGRAQLREEVAVERRDADLEAGEVGLLDLLVEV